MRLSTKENPSSALKRHDDGDDDCGENCSFVHDASFSLDGSLIAAGYDDRTLRVRHRLVTNPYFRGF